MVPTTPGGRFAALLAFVPEGVSYASLDRAAGVSEGTAKQLATGKKAGASAANAFAHVLGTTTEYLLFGRGRPPGRRTVQAAIAAAREASGEAHAAKVRGNPGSRKGYDSAAASTSGASR